MNHNYKIIFTNTNAYDKFWLLDYKLVENNF